MSIGDLQSWPRSIVVALLLGPSLVGFYVIAFDRENVIALSELGDALAMCGGLLGVVVCLLIGVACVLALRHPKARPFLFAGWPVLLRWPVYLAIWAGFAFLAWRVGDRFVITVLETVPGQIATTAARVSGIEDRRGRRFSHRTVTVSTHGATEPVRIRVDQRRFADSVWADEAVMVVGRRVMLVGHGNRFGVFADRIEVLPESPRGSALSPP